jgi:hypothetical protein
LSCGDRRSRTDRPNPTKGHFSLGRGATYLHIHVDGVPLLTAWADGEYAAQHGDTVILTPKDGHVHGLAADGKVITS